MLAVDCSKNFIIKSFSLAFMEIVVKSSVEAERGRHFAAGGWTFEGQ